MLDFCYVNLGHGSNIITYSYQHENPDVCHPKHLIVNQFYHTSQLFCGLPIMPNLQLYLQVLIIMHRHLDLFSPQS